MAYHNDVWFFLSFTSILLLAIEKGEKDNESWSKGYENLAVNKVIEIARPETDTFLK